MIWHPRHQAAIAGLAILLLALGTIRCLQRPALAPAPGSESDGAGGPSVAVRLDPNIATEAELSVVPGIGKSRAKEIVKARSAGKRFEKLEDLDDVKRIGASSLEQAEKYLVFPQPRSEDPG